MSATSFYLWLRTALSDMHSGVAIDTAVFFGLACFIVGFALSWIRSAKRRFHYTFWCVSIVLALWMNFFGLGVCSRGLSGDYRRVQCGFPHFALDGSYLSVGLDERFDSANFYWLYFIGNFLFWIGVASLAIQVFEIVRERLFPQSSG